MRPAVGFFALLVCFWFVARHFGVAVSVPTAASVALLLAPYWAFGFGFDKWLRANFNHVAAPLLLTVSYLVFALPQGLFRWDMFLGMAAVVLAITLLLRHADPAMPDWRDWVVLAILGLSVEFHFFDRAWPVGGLSGMPKLLFVDAGLYGYLVVRPIEGIGFDFRLRRSDVMVGLREFLYFTPIAIALGFALGFLHLHRTPGSVPAFAAGWLFTLFFVALPEELFFRGTDAEYARAAYWHAAGARDHIADFRPRAFQQARRVLQLAICDSRRRRRGFLWTRVARPAAIARVIDYARYGRYRVVNLAAVG